MKRLLLATSILALAAGGAFAQGMSNAPSTAPRSGTSTMAPTTPGASSSTTGSSSMGSSSTGSSMTGSSSTRSSSTDTSMTGSSGSSSQASSDDVVKAQQALKQQGLYKGSVDGKVGPETRTAISQFQKKNGLQQTAQLDQQTMGQLEGSGGMNSSKPSSGARMPSNSSAGPGATSPGGMSGGTSGTDKDDDNDAH